MLESIKNWVSKVNWSGVSDEEVDEYIANLPEYKVETVYGDRSLRKSIDEHSNLGYEVVDITQKLVFGSNAGRTVTFKLRD